MLSRILGRILYAAYPLLVLGVALTAWSSSSLSDVKSAPPIMSDGFSFFWNPLLLTRNSCAADSDKIQKLNSACSHRQNETQIKAN